MGTIPIEVKNMTDGTYDTVEMGSTGTTGSGHYSYFKMIHISKACAAPTTCVATRHP